MTTSELLSLLEEGKPKGKGRADEVAVYVLQNGEEALATLWPGLVHSNSVIKARTAHVVEAVAKLQPGWLLSYRPDILYQFAQPALHPEFYFYIPPLLGMISWEEDDIPVVVDRLEYWLQHLDHQFVKVFCLQSLTDISLQHLWLQNGVRELVHKHMAKGGKAINARGRMLLKKLR